MALEIERKFLVADDSWKQGVIDSTRIVQGYLAQTDRATVRVRVRGEQGFLTVKGMTSGITRSEFEYQIGAADAAAMLEALAQGPVIDKVRHIVPVAGHDWEIDVFEGANEGLVLAEVELASAEESFELPVWAGREVSDDPRYFNVYLATRPFRTWGGE